MRTRSLFILFLFSLLPLVTAAQDLVEIGTGTVRYLGMIRVYDAALLAPAAANPQQIQQAATSFCLVLDYHVDLQAIQAIEAAEKVLQRQHDPPTLARYRARIEQLHASYRAVSEGDQYRFCYQSASDTLRLILNGRILTELPGSDFASLYAGIWLSDRAPLDKRLQRKLIGFPKEGS